MLTIGIIGGMGPMATVDLYNKIINLTPASCDQEHLRIIIDNHPQIPSRMTAIMQGTESPLPKLVESAKLLEQAGVDIIGIGCNTAHYWYNDIQSAIKVPILNMIDNAAVYVKDNRPELSGKIMLMATKGTVKTKLYSNAFCARDLELKLPQPEDQEIIEAAITEVKAGRIADNKYLPNLKEVMDSYAKQGIQAFIGGCTEIPLLFEHLQGDFEKFDSTMLLAQTLVKKALA